ncbi:uncharacterized protein LOC5514016 isoform X2 [Nematostella vectensis]|uniref:uncharacterized protein LOC5514016 isoform X2 n=1 Tax=Nematostella vectensis TaxID=45351 RepID=UPI00207727F7|nr:uncharacterized protein LOC5514016 isoform X2 [Nematostella vectensis]
MLLFGTSTCSLQECSDVVGLSSGQIEGSKLNSSSTKYPVNLFGSHQGRLYNAHAWCATKDDAEPYLEIDIGFVRMIKSIATQGNPKDDQFVTSYALESYVIPEVWVTYLETGARRIFQGNSDGGQSVKNILKHITPARKIRVHPVTWYGHVCLRVELYGCDADPMVSLGMHSGEIPDWAITASSTFSTTYPPHKGRLNWMYSGSKQAWVSAVNDVNQFFQVNLQRRHYVTAVATQRRFSTSQYVTSYKVQHSKSSCGSFTTVLDENGQHKVFPGNADNEAVVRNILPYPLYTRCVRICPQSWINHISLRADMYTYGIASAVDMIEGNNNAVYTASSSYNENHVPNLAIFSATIGARSWCPLTISGAHWLKIYIGHVTIITAIVTMGRGGSHARWVTTFQMSYSVDGNVFQDYKDAAGSYKTFQANKQHTGSVTIWLNPKIKAKFVKIYPKTWVPSTDILCMRAQLLGHKNGDIGAPAFMDITADIVANKNEDVSLPCTSTGDLPITTTWSHNGQVVQTSSSHSNLVLSHVNGSQAGSYNCTVTNSRGSNSRTTYLRVKEPLSMCSNYATLNDDSRLLSRVTSLLISDDVSINETNWYQFTGKAGYYHFPGHVVPEGRCGATASGWMSGTHPSVSEGVVKRTVCFHSNSQECRYSVSVYVRNCFGFYVYKLRKLDAAWNARYCVDHDKGGGSVKVFSQVSPGQGETRTQQIMHIEYHVTSEFTCMLYCLLHVGCHTFDYREPLKTCKLSNVTGPLYSGEEHSGAIYGTELQTSVN